MRLCVICPNVEWTQKTGLYTVQEPVSVRLQFDHRRTAIQAMPNCYADLLLYLELQAQGFFALDCTLYQHAKLVLTSPHYARIRGSKRNTPPGNVTLTLYDCS